MASKIFAGWLLALSFVVTAAHAQSSPNYTAIVAAPDRSAADRKLDGNRAPAQWLAFLGVKPGVLVGICLKRTVAMIESVLAALKASQV